METNEFNSKIVFYDGECGFCGGFTRFVWKNDPDGAVYFCSLQSKEGKRMLSDAGVNEVDFKTMYYIEDGLCYERSQAVLRIFGRLGFPFSAISILRCLPLRFTDYFYDRIANRRHVISDKLGFSSCEIPPVEVRNRFIA